MCDPPFPLFMCCHFIPNFRPQFLTLLTHILTPGFSFHVFSFISFNFPSRAFEQHTFYIAFAMAWLITIIVRNRFFAVQFQLLGMFRRERGRPAIRHARRPPPYPRKGRTISEHDVGELRSILRHHVEICWCRECDRLSMRQRVQMGIDNLRPADSQLLSPMYWQWK